MTNKSLGEHFLDFVDKIGLITGEEVASDNFITLKDNWEWDHWFQGWLFSQVEVEDKSVLEYYIFEEILEEATNIFKERQKQLELEF